MEDSIRRQIEDIAEDRASGASRLTGHAAELYGTAASLLAARTPKEILNALQDIAEALREAQPDMAPIYVLSETLFSKAKKLHDSGKDAPSIVKAIRQGVQEFLQKQKEAHEKIAAHAFDVVGEGATLLTHSYSSTVMKTLSRLHQIGRNFHLVATEARPGFEGRRLVEDLGRLGIPCTLIVDAAAYVLLPKCHAVVVGADRITETAFVNKIGTCSLALGAKHYGRKFYVFSDTCKCVPSSLFKTNGKPHPSHEVFDEPHPNVKVENPYFEETPLTLVTGVVTEKGLMDAQAIASVVEKRVSKN